MTNLERRRVMARMKRIEEAREERFRRFRMLESRGQRITDRPTNRPYDPEKDVLVDKKFEREVQVIYKHDKNFANELKNDINKIFSDFSKGIGLIEEYNNSVDDDFKINSVEIPFRDGAWFEDTGGSGFTHIEFKKIVWFEFDDLPGPSSIWYNGFKLNDMYAMFSLANPYSEGWEFPIVSPQDYMNGGYKAKYDNIFDWNIVFQTSFKNPFGGGQYDCVVIPIMSYINYNDSNLDDTSVKDAMLTSVEEQFDNNQYDYDNFFENIKITLPDNDFGKTVAKTLNNGKGNNNVLEIYFDEKVYNNLKRIVNTCKKLMLKF